MAEEELLRLNLDVYDTGKGPWNPEHGDVTIPGSWEFLPSGDAFMTRTVKATGVFWVSWRPRGRNRPHRRLLGLWAPAPEIAKARAVAVETAAARERKREQGSHQRARAEERYRDQLAAAIVEFLAFDDAHEDQAIRIAREASAHAGIVGSGRVGRTRTLPLEERAALAARAFIRHRFTDYHQRLDAVHDELIDALTEEDLDSISEIPQVDEFEYRQIKSDANRAVDEFLASHRTPKSA